MPEPNPVFRPGGASYLRIPAADPHDSAHFYAAVFGWQVETDRDEPSFSDGGGQVIGHFRRGLVATGEHGVRPYVFVADLDAALDRARAEGAEIVEPPYPEGDLRIAAIRDPAGNVVGVWQHAPSV